MFNIRVGDIAKKRSLPYIVILIMTFLLLLTPISNGDELWNYNFARNIAQGHLPYQDFSIVQTPLSCYISGAFLWLFGDGMRVFKILTAILFVSIAVLFFRLCKTITHNAGVALAGAVFVMSSHLCFFIYNYNYVTALVLLIIFALEFRETERSIKHTIIGVLVGTTILIKQNSGLFIWLANVIICFREYKVKHISIKNCLLRICFSILPVFAYLVYMLLTGILYDFIDYAVVGISTFTHRFTPIDFLTENTFFAPYLIVILIMFILIGVRIFKTEATSFQFSAGMFSLAWASVMYPLADASHILLILFLLIPAFLSCYQLDKVKYKKVVFSAVFVIAIMFSMFVLQQAKDFGFYVSELPNFNGVFIDVRNEEKVKAVDDYILAMEAKGYTVRIADTSAVIYMIPLDKYEKNWDMLLVGNLGTNSVQDLLETDSPTIYLVKKDSSLYDLQDHYELIGYIKENYTKIGEVSGFDAYTP